ncbi:unnamed protein product [Vitrella brassicaformis CCMP3155]|uniref:PDZ domain-containing protein n=1 Tax=Vitrella brassicaformis (strain CCMP3155) TaxID=1169540 RepID=A0A0G4F7K0_VITBC|nr:unnamed protein product [Vitrella brassicaformis CCMP3155]|eukprot:CEM08661.1 unnamed protein product [Vitrella brassicaformis CCMP3155]
MLDFQSGFAHLFDQLRPAMVRIYASAERHQPLKDAIYLGSGFIYKPEGFVLTAGHLFEAQPPPGTPGGFQYFVRMSDGRWFRANVRGKSSDADVAVLQIMPPKPLQLPAVTFANLRERPRQGEWVVTYGTTQYGDEPVAVMGTVSQPRQSFRKLEEGQRIRFIQMGMITIPGMSGAPVCDVHGKVVAMVVKKFQEYGLALPIQHVHGVASCIEETGSWTFPYLGMVLKDHVDEVEGEETVQKDEGSGSGAGRFWDKLLHPKAAHTPDTHHHPGGEKARRGVLVAQVKGGTPAEEAGIRSGDLILSVNGQPVYSHFEVFESMGYRTGDTVKLQLLRGGRLVDVKVTSTQQQRL